MLLTVSTVKDSVDNVAFFVAANLASGVDHMFVFLDAPAEPEQRDVAASLAGHPHVTCIPTTRRDWWREERPHGLNVRQRTNAGWVRSVLEPFTWAEWLFHVDGDEVACLDRAALAAVPPGVDAVWLPPWEAVSEWQPDGDRPRRFKRLLDEADLTLLQVLGRIPEATNQAYFHGHVMGKSGVRPASGSGLTLHDAVAPDGTRLERHEDPRLKVLHYDAPSGEEFVRKWTALAQAGPARYRASRAPVAKALRTLVGRDLPDDVRAKYLREVYEATTRDDVETLGELGLLEGADPTAPATAVAPRRLEPADAERLAARVAELSDVPKGPYLVDDKPAEQPAGRREQLRRLARRG
ncbi:glycosyltransferase family 2 protein [Nocardioides sp.]|uniref:glycosyltransferase family 2 protein n=1 Tax=Nocardioides sp. TaxID=35761 RepID=UPI0027213C30|nr:glycosyltransferase family 2 protein [Nocardioides sp.]MDO9456141.1 glycosyltransferase family 2 protein [Nocardioides sp.]